MKKITAFFLAAVMTLSLAGCATKEGTSGDLSDSSSSTTSSSKSSSKSSSSSEFPEEPAESSTVSTPEESSSSSSSTSSEATKPAEQSTTTSSSVPESSTKQSSSTVPKDPQSSSQSTASSTKSSSSVPAKDPEPAVSDDTIRPEVKLLTEQYIKVVEKMLEFSEKYEGYEADDIPEEAKQEAEKLAGQFLGVVFGLASLGEVTPAEEEYMNKALEPYKDKLEQMENT